MIVSFLLILNHYPKNHLYFHFLKTYKCSNFFEMKLLIFLIYPKTRVLFLILWCLPKLDLFFVLCLFWEILCQFLIWFSLFVFLKIVLEEINFPILHLLQIFSSSSFSSLLGIRLGTILSFLHFYLVLNALLMKIYDFYFFSIKK